MRETRKWEKVLEATKNCGRQKEFWKRQRTVEKTRIMGENVEMWERGICGREWSTERRKGRSVGERWTI